MDEATLALWVDHPIPSKRMKTRFLSRIGTKRIVRPWIQVAAVLLPFFLLMGGFTFVASRLGLFSAPEYAEFSVPAGEHLQVVLQDGTVVHLNSASRLRYPKTFGLFSRRVELSGEGFFTVAKEPRRPFVVDMNLLQVRVTGTRFNAKAYPSDSRIFVTLEEGGVSLEDSFHNAYPLIPGESAEYDKQLGVCTISKVNDIASITAWRTNSLNFYRTPLREILLTLERQYDARFVLTDTTLYREKFTLSTSKVVLSEILDDLQRVSKTRFVWNNEGYYSVETSN